MSAQSLVRLWPADSREQGNAAGSEPRNRRDTTLLCLVLLAGVAPALAQPRGELAAEAVGHWRGEADIIVTWCRQETLPFDLTVHPDGTVTGTAGDAKLANGRFRRNNLLLIWLGNSRYYIEGDLEGPIVAAEQIERDSLRVFVDLEAGAMKGGFRTSGTKAGGRRTMVMTGRRLVLERYAGARDRRRGPARGGVE